MRPKNLEETFICDDGRKWKVLCLRVDGHDGRIRKGLKVYKRVCIMEVQEVQRQMFRSFVMCFPDSVFGRGILHVGDEVSLARETREWVFNFCNVHSEPVGWGFGDSPLYKEYE